MLNEWAEFESSHTKQVDHDGVPEQQWKSHEHPGKKRGLKVQEAEEVHTYERMSSTPHIHQHDDKGLTQEEDVGEQTEQLRDFRLNKNIHLFIKSQSLRGQTNLNSWSFSLREKAIYLKKQGFIHLLVRQNWNITPQ